METSSYNFTDSQKESCAVTAVMQLSLFLLVKTSPTKKHCFVLQAPAFIMHFSITVQKFGKRVQTTFLAFMISATQKNQLDILPRPVTRG